MLEDTIYSFRKELEALGYSKGVVTGYPRYIKHFLLFIGEIPTKITAEHIKNYHHYLQQRPNKMKKGTLSESCIAGNLRAIKTYFNYLQRTHQIKSNPFILKIKKPQYKARTILSQDEIAGLYTHCKTQQERVILHLCYGCGLRKSEAQNLNIQDINFEKRLLYVQQGKGKKRRVIPLTQQIVNDFKLYLKARESTLTQQQVGENQIPFLVNNQGHRIYGGMMYHLFKNILKKAGKPAEISLHHLRHSIATHLLENNMSIEMVRDFLGHNQLNTTQIYTRVNLRRNEQQKI